MKPEDFGITKYQMDASGKLEILQHVDMSGKGLSEFPFETSRINGHLNLSNNKFKNTDSILFPIQGDLKINHNQIEEIDCLLKNCNKNRIYANHNKITEIKISDNLKHSTINLGSNPLNKIKFDMNYFEGGLMIANTNITDFSNFPKFIYEFGSGGKNKDIDWKTLPDFNEGFFTHARFENLEGFPTKISGISFIKCYMKSLKFFPFFVSHSVLFENCTIENFDCEISSRYQDIDQAKKNIFITENSLIYNASDFSKRKNLFENYDDFLKLIEESKKRKEIIQKL